MLDSCSAKVIFRSSQRSDTCVPRWSRYDRGKSMTPLTQGSSIFIFYFLPKDLIAWAFHWTWLSESQLTYISPSLLGMLCQSWMWPVVMEKCQICPILSEYDAFFIYKKISKCRFSAVTGRMPIRADMWHHSTVMLPLV